MNYWSNYELFWLHIYIYERFSLAYLMPIPLFSLFSWFLYCNTCSNSTKIMKPRNISTEWAKVLPFAWEKLLWYREIMCFLIDNLFENIFQASRATGLITLLYNCMWNSHAEKYLISWKRYFLVCWFISTLFPCFSEFSLN